MRATCLPLLFLAAACATLSSDDQQRLDAYRRNAEDYFTGGKPGQLEQCSAMIGKGLEIDGDNYALNSLKGAVLVRQANAESGARHDQLLQDAERQLAKVQAWRADNEHQPYQLWYYQMALHGVALSQTAEAARLRKAAARQPSGTGALDNKLAQADELERRAKARNLRARQLLQTLLQRGELLLLAHQGLIEVETALGNFDGRAEKGAVDGSFAHGEAFLKQLALEKAVAHKRMREARSLDGERQQRAVLDELRDREIVVRHLLAEVHYDRRDYAEAVQHLDVVLQLAPDSTADYFNRARALRELGRLDAAKADFRTFIATSMLPPNNPKMEEALQALSPR